MIRGGIIFLGLCLAPQNTFAQAKEVAKEKSPSYEFRGEVRGSYQYIRERGATYTNQQLQRMRALLGLEASPAEDFTLGLQLATGTTSPTSRFQDMGGSWTRKSVGVDLAFVRWKPAAKEGLFLEAGKVALPFYKMMGSELVFDGDVNPEGIAIGLSPEIKGTKLELRGGHFVVEERSSSSDSFLAGVQIVGRTELSPKSLEFLLGGSFYPYRNVAGKTFFGSGTNRRGNSTVTSNLYSEEYKIGEAFLESTYYLGKLPLTLGYQIVKNFSASTPENMGWLGAFRVGKIKEKGDWETGISHRVIDKDAVLGAFNDSDFAGGGTNARGSDAKLTYAVEKNLRLALIYINSFNNYSGGRAHYQRYRMDMTLNF